MKKLNADFRGGIFHGAAIGTCLALSLFSSPASFGQTVYELEDYSNRLMAMNVPAAHENYIGKGAAVVHMEGETIFWDALDTDREPVFGSCTVPVGAISDTTGWEPAGNDCKIAWVMCFKVGWGGQRVQSCRFEADRTHATNVAKAMTVVAPAAKIISIKINATDGRAYKLAADWLITPSADSEWYADNNFSPDEASHYNNYFGGKSPAEFWNVVAINGSFHQIGTEVGDVRGKEGRVLGNFSESCEVYNDTTDFRPEKYIVDWWANHDSDKKQFLAYTGFDAGSEILRKHGIMPIFAAHNFLWKRKYKDSDGNTQIEKFVTQNGVAFPACLASTFAVSGIAFNFADISGRHKYVGSSVHRQLTDFVAPGSGAASFSTPMVTGAVAVLRSSNLVPDASIDDIVRYLGATRLDDAGRVVNKAEVGFSCDPNKRAPHDRDVFPGGPGSYWNEHKSLDCNNGDPVPTPYKSPYTKVVIDLGAATELAAQDRGRQNTANNSLAPGE